MRRLAFTGGVTIAAAAAASVAFAATGDPGRRHVAPSYVDASHRTLLATSQRFSIDVTVNTKAKPVALHVNGVSGPGAFNVRMKLDDTKAVDGTAVPGMTGGVILDSPFLYERAPSGMVPGKVQWLRLRLDDLSPTGAALGHIRNLMPRTLLQVLAETKMRFTGDAGVYGGWIPYSDPVVRRGLGALTGGIEFRSLHALVLVGRDGRVHRIRITGSTADGSRTLLLLAHFYAFNAPVTVKAPRAATFMDPKRELLSN